MKLTRVGFRAHVKIASRIVSYVLQFTTVADKLGIPSQDSKVWGPGPHVNCAVWRKSVGRCVQLLPVTAVYRPSSEAAARDSGVIQSPDHQSTTASDVGGALDSFSFRLISSRVAAAAAADNAEDACSRADIARRRSTVAVGRSPHRR